MRSKDVCSRIIKREENVKGFQDCMSRPVKNRNIFYSEGHFKLLWKLALQVAKSLSFPVELDDLVSIGWYKQARYYDNLHGRSRDIIREMYCGAKKLKPVWYEIRELMGRSRQNRISKKKGLIFFQN